MSSVASLLTRRSPFRCLMRQMISLVSPALNGLSVLESLGGIFADEAGTDAGC